MNAEDEKAGEYLRVFTFLPLDEIAGLERRQREEPASRVAQNRLAFEITRLVHGEETAKAVASASNILFGAGVGELTPDVLPHLATAVPTTALPAATLAPLLPVLETLATPGLASSRGAR